MTVHHSMLSLLKMIHRNVPLLVISPSTSFQTRYYGWIYGRILWIDCTFIWLIVFHAISQTRVQLVSCVRITASIL